MANGEKKLPAGFNEYVDVASAIETAKDHWQDTGRTTRYSTGLKVMDEYLGGGYGMENAGEVILIHATSKTFKSTLSMQLIRTPIEQGEKVGLIILEGTFWRAVRNFKQLFTNAGYDTADEILEKNKDNIFAMSDRMSNGDFSMDDVIRWLENCVVAHGVHLFLIDPIGYLSDYSNEWNVPEYKKESKFMKQLVQFADNTHSTVICIQHNTKGNEFDNRHREAAIGGSQSFSKSPTKVIEIRREGLIDESRPEIGRKMSMEFYMGRDVPDKRYYPIVFHVCFHPDGKGKSIFCPVFRDQDHADNELHNADKEKRKVWWGQVDTNSSDLEEMMYE